MAFETSAAVVRAAAKYETTPRQVGSCRVEYGREHAAAAQHVGLENRFFRLPARRNRRDACDACDSSDANRKE